MQQNRETGSIDVDQQFYSRGRNRLVLSLSQLLVNRDEETVGKDSCETQFYYAPIPDNHTAATKMPTDDS